MPHARLRKILRVAPRQVNGASCRRQGTQPSMRRGSRLIQMQPINRNYLRSHSHPAPLLAALPTPRCAWPQPANAANASKTERPTSGEHRKGACADNSDTDRERTLGGSPCRLPHYNMI